MSIVSQVWRRPRVFYGWYIVMAHMLAHFYMSTVFVYGIGAFFTPMIAELSWTRAQFSVAGGLQRLEGSIATPIIGFLVDRIGARRVITAGVVFATVGFFLMSRVDTLWTFYGAYVVIALGMSSIIGVPFMTAAAKWFKRKRGRAMGLMFVGATFSGLFLPLLVFLIEYWGWRATMVACAVGVLAVGIPGVLIVRDRPEPYGYRPDGDPPEIEGAQEDSPAGPPGPSPQRPLPPPEVEGLTVRETLKHRSFWILTLVFGLTSMGPSAMFLHQIPYFESIGFSPATAATTVAAFTLLSGIGRVGVGWLMDFFERRMVIVLLAVLHVAGLLVLVNVTAYWHSLVYALLFGIAFGGMIPARPIMVGAFYGTQAFGALAGLLQSLAVVGGVAAPILLGWVYDSTGTYQPAILVLAGVVSLSIPIAFLLPKSRAPRQVK